GASTLRSRAALIGAFASLARAAAAHPPTSRSATAQAATLGIDEILLIDDERMHRMLLELIAAMEERELDHERDAHDAPAQLIDDRAAEDEAPRLDSDHHVHSLLPVAAGEAVDDAPERGAVLQERGDVLEEDSLGREVPDVPDLCLELRHVHRAISYLRCRD